MTFKLSHMAVAFALGVFVTLSILLASGEYGQGRLPKSMFNMIESACER